MSTNCLFLSADAVRRALSVREAIEAMRDAFTQLQRCEVTQPPRLRLDARDENGTALVMQCHSASQKLFSLKFITLFKSVSMAVQDLCAAARALANARQLGLGTPLHL